MSAHCIVCGEVITTELFSEHEIFCSINCRMATMYDMIDERTPAHLRYHPNHRSYPIDDPYVGLDEYEDPEY